jgi:broad specificity phosphatase PhoE
LTPAGRAEARYLGRQLPDFARLTLIHTRVERTRETAKNIGAGFLKSHPGARVALEGFDPTLSLVTFYSRDAALRDALKAQLGDRFYDEWLQGKVPRDVLAPVEEAVSDFVERLRSRAMSAPASSLLLAVTHDVYVSAIRQVLFGTSAEKRPPIGFLDGILLAWDDANNLVARWRDDIVSRGVGSAVLRREKI